MARAIAGGGESSGGWRFSGSGPSEPLAIRRSPWQGTCPGAGWTRGTWR